VGNELNGGRCEIRTHGAVADTPDFKSGAFNRSANLPGDACRRARQVKIIAPRSPEIGQQAPHGSQALEFGAQDGI
jgi:hypothetical protein